MSDSGSESAGNVSLGGPGLGASPGAPGGASGSEVSQVALAEPKAVASYVQKIAAVLLEDMAGGEPVTQADREHLAALETALFEPKGLEAFSRFIAEPQTPVLLIERVITVKDEDVEMSGTESETEQETVSYQVSTEVRFSSPKMSSFVVIKRGSQIEADKSVGHQVRLLSLGDGSPYETLHCYISAAVAPYFKSYVKETGKADREGDKMTGSVEKKLAELEMGLLHLQQNIEIPDITLPPHPVVQGVIKKAAEEGRRARVADFGDKVDDSVFLNSLQNGVNRWIREIQKVCFGDGSPA